MGAPSPPPRDAGHRPADRPSRAGGRRSLSPARVAPTRKGPAAMPDTPYARELESTTLAFIRAVASEQARVVLGRGVAEAALNWGTITLDRIRDYLKRP